MKQGQTALTSTDLELIRKIIRDELTIQFDKLRGQISNLPTKNEFDKFLADRHVIPLKNGIQA